VDNRNEIREFLASQRARLTPEQAGVPTFAGQRRVPGLRRSEVAQLAGVSIEYYIRLERGNLAGVSEGVLDATATALQLEEAEREHCLIWHEQRVRPQRRGDDAGRRIKKSG
jgi:transcriptional regulator with XRE-family HTH domain